VAGLFTPGITAFADFGTAWFADETDFTMEDLRGALGIGLRFGMNRAALNAPLRVDFAWPVLYSTDRSAPVISIGVGQVF
jgi:outer membrane translocation and assembly module TamA